MQLSIIIVSYNVRAILAQCLASIKEAGHNLEYEVIVVDNLSLDGTANYFSGGMDKATFIWNKENLGFAKANNLGLSKAKGDYILFLNPDTIVTKDSLEKTIMHIAQTPKCGAVGVYMTDGTGNYLPESKRQVPSTLSSFFYLSGIAKLNKKSRLLNGYHASNIDKYERSEVPILSGAFMMAETKVLKDIGGFDPRYFMYAEDVDLSMSIEKLGYKNWYLGDIKILHYKGESSRTKNFAHYKSFFGAMKIFTQKHNNKFSAAIKCSLINMAYILYLLKSKLNASKHSHSNKLPYSSAIAHCTAQEKVTLELWNSKVGFAKEIIFSEDVSNIHPDADVLLYSSSLLCYSNLVNSIANSNKKLPTYILNNNKLIGSNGKDVAAEVFEL